MAEEESRLKIFDDHVNIYLLSKLQVCESKIARLSNKCSVEEASDLLAEANGLLSFFCGEDEVLYESLRYRMFVDESTKKIHIVFGEEIDVNYRAWEEYTSPDGNSTNWDDNDDEISGEDDDAMV